MLPPPATHLIVGLTVAACKRKATGGTKLWAGFLRPFRPPNLGRSGGSILIPGLHPGLDSCGPSGRPTVNLHVRADLGSIAQPLDEAAGAALLEEGRSCPGNVHPEGMEVMIWRTRDDPSCPSPVSSPAQPWPGLRSSERAPSEGRDWRIEVVRVHARFHGRPGTFAQFGDSITETLAFWAPLKHARKNASPRMERAFRLVEARLRPECWSEWKGPEFGNQGGRTIGWAEENVAAWLERLNPEVAVVMFGTNDLRDLGVNEYRNRLRSVVRKCLARGTVVILSTIPPRHGFARKAAEFALAARTIARELSVPLVDYHAEVLKRRPNDWDGATDGFKEFEGYDVPTLLARDGVHPSAPRLYQDDYSDEVATEPRLRPAQLRRADEIRRGHRGLDRAPPGWRPGPGLAAHPPPERLERKEFRN